MFYIRTLALFLLIPAIVFAQDSTKHKIYLLPRSHIEIVAFGGGQVTTFSNINARLKSLNLSTLNPSTLCGGFGMAIRFNKLLVGFDISAPGNWVKEDIEITGVYYRFYLSTNILKSGNWIFSPQIGIGGQTIYAKITQHGTTQSFDEAITIAPNQVKITNDNTMLDVAMALKIARRKNINTPLFRLGYRYGLTNAQWKIENGSANDGPRDRASNFYFQVLFGFGN